MDGRGLRVVIVVLLTGCMGPGAVAETSPDDPPPLLDNPETAAVPTTRSLVVHSVQHVQAECAADGVECIVRQNHPQLAPRSVALLVARLRAEASQAACVR